MTKKHQHKMTPELEEFWKVASSLAEFAGSAKEVIGYNSYSSSFDLWISTEYQRIKQLEIEQQADKLVKMGKSVDEQSRDHHKLGQEPVANTVSDKINNRNQHSSKKRRPTPG